MSLSYKSIYSSQSCNLLLDCDFRSFWDDPSYQRKDTGLGRDLRERWEEST